MANKNSVLNTHLHRHKKKITYSLLTVLVVFLLFEIAIFLWGYMLTLFYPEILQDHTSVKIVGDSKLKDNFEKLPPFIEHGSRFQYKVALTFDADMTTAMQRLLKFKIVKSWYNQEVKQILDRENVKATIFFTGLWVETYPQQARELANDPLIEVASHSYSHPGFTKDCYGLPFSDDSKDNQEITKAQAAIQKATGITPKYFRFPGGCFDANDLKSVNDLGLKVVHWDVVGGDGFNKDADSIVRKVESTVQNGSIIVLHIQGGPFAPKTHEALAKIIPFLKKQGYQMVTVSELLNE